MRDIARTIEEIVEPRRAIERRTVNLASANPVIQRGIQVPSNGYPTAAYEDPTIPSSQMGKIDPFTVKGAVGTVFFGGILTDLYEYNVDVKDDAWFDVAEQMWRSSSAVRAVSQCIALPLLRAQWIVRPGSESSHDKEIAQKVSDNLFDGMSITWRSFLWQAIAKELRYGNAAFEKCWNRDDRTNETKLRRLDPRANRSLYRWYIDPETNELDRIQQRVWVPDEAGVTGTWHYPVIPASKLLLFSYEREDNWFKGTPLFRHMYEDFYYAKNLKAINAMAIERNGMGYPWFNEPPGAQEADRIYARRVLASLHAHEQMYGTSPNGWEFDFKTTSGGKEALPSIDWHNRQIFLTGLCTFAVDQGGSYAKSQDLSSFFTESLYAFGFSIAEEIDRCVIREMVDFLEEEPPERYPSLQVKGLDRRQMGTWLRSIAPMFAAGALTRDDDTENAIRDWFDWPQLPIAPSAAPGGDITVDTESQGPAASDMTQAEQMDAKGLPTTQPQPGGQRSSPRQQNRPVQAGPRPGGNVNGTAAAGAVGLADEAALVETMLQWRPPWLSGEEWQRIVGEEVQRAGKRGRA